MILITVSLVLAIGVASVMLVSHRSEEARLTEPKTSILTVGVQIVCGNCAGDEQRPERTYLDRDGNCSQCGGHSYVLASNLYARSSVARHAEFDGMPASGKVLPFSSQRPKRIAV
jgi:hypothetical protein